MPSLSPLQPQRSHPPRLYLVPRSSRVPVRPSQTGPGGGDAAKAEAAAPAAIPALSRQSTDASEYHTPPGSPLCPSTPAAAPPTGNASPGRTNGADGTRVKKEEGKKKMTKEDKYDMVGAVTGAAGAGITSAALGLNGHIAQQSAEVASKPTNTTAPASKRAPRPFPAMKLGQLLGMGRSARSGGGAAARPVAERPATPAAPAAPAAPARQNAAGSEFSVNGPTRAESVGSNSAPGSPARPARATTPAKEEEKKDEEKVKLSTKLGAYSGVFGLVGSLGYLGVAAANQDTQNKKEAADATRRAYEEHSTTQFIDMHRLASLTPAQIIEGSLDPAKGESGKTQTITAPHDKESTRGADPARIVDTNTFPPHRRRGMETQT